MKRLFHKHKKDHGSNHSHHHSGRRTSVTASYGNEVDGSSHTYGCIHYLRKCAYVSPCCRKIYPCRVCHDDKEDHKIDRFKVSELLCTECQTVQSVHPSCTQCGVRFGRYFCLICRMFDDVDKQQFHCEKCGLCRVGGENNFFHCDKCDVCMCIELKDSHTCVEKVTHSDCPVCLDDLHTSRETLQILSCGHVTHLSCWIEMLKSGNYSCAICGHSMLNMENVWSQLDKMIAQTGDSSIPPNIVWILCRDCHQRSKVQFHRLGLKCNACGSYNTCRDDPLTAIHSKHCDSDHRNATSAISQPESRVDEPHNDGGIALLESNKNIPFNTTF